MGTFWKNRTQKATKVVTPWRLGYWHGLQRGDRAIAELLARVQELEQENTALKIEKARWIVQSREREY